MAELISDWDDRGEIRRLVWSDASLVRDGNGILDGEVVVIYQSPLIPNYSNDGFHREEVVRQTPSNIIIGNTL